MTVKELLNKAIGELKKAKIEDASLKSKMILSFTLNKTKEYLFIHENDEVSLESEEIFKLKIEQLCKNVPLQYLTHTKEFMGLNFYVDENVLIPRADTEILVEEVLKELNSIAATSLARYQIKILDMCTGSGAIAVSFAKYCDNVEITAVDKSSEALKIAKKNAEINNVLDKIKFINSDMFSMLENNNFNFRNKGVKKFDIIVSNPPYIETEVISTLNKDVQKEPVMALDGGEDGLDFYRIIAENSINFLNENGKVFLEIGYNQKKSVSEIFNKYFKSVTCIKDFAGNDRVIIAKN